MKETAQKQPLSAMVPLEEGQLARAAAYIQERIYGRSLTCEEFDHRAPKGLPDRIKAMAATRLPSDLSPALPVQAVASHPSFDETLPLVGLALGQRSPVVAARRQFKPFAVSSRAAERGWLASAAKLILEHINRHSPGREELARRTPEEPPDEVAEIVAEAPQQQVNIAATEIGVSTLRSLAFLFQLGMVMLSMPMVPPGTAHNVMSIFGDANAPRSHSFLVVQQSGETIEKRLTREGIRPKGRLRSVG